MVSPGEMRTGQWSLPGGCPVMPCTIQQGAHVCLVSPSNIDHQHAWEKGNQKGHSFCFNYEYNENYNKLEPDF